jgi:hypothetical protein
VRGAEGMMTIPLPSDDGPDKDAPGK